MLEVAVPKHLACIEHLIHAGAAEGSWDPDLARSGAKADGLFARIGYALEHGTLPQVDARTGRRIVTRIGGWVFLSEPGSAPCGFGLYKDFADDGMELWLCGIEASARGHGLGRRMLTELLATPLGQQVQFARCSLSAPGGQRCAHILKSLGFETARTTSREEWLLHRRTPPRIAQLIATMDLSPFESGPPYPRQA